MLVKKIFYCLFIAISVIACKKENANKKIKPTEITFKHEGNLQILDSTQTVIKTLAIEFAEDDYEHQTGLMYRKQMDSNKGMLFIFNDDDVRIRSFYMKNTYIPLDIIFIDANQKIINIAKDAEPLNENSLFSEAPAKYVLEINAGLSEQWHLKPGQRILFTRL